jgi:hypothetical protein
MNLPIRFGLILCAFSLCQATLQITQSDSPVDVLGAKLASLAAANGGTSTDCGSANIFKPEDKPTTCARAAFDAHRAFQMVYTGGYGYYQAAYGLAGDASGKVYEVGYDSRGLLHLGMDERSEVFDNNRLRVTPCVPPVRLATTQRGVLACITPVNEEESKLAAKQTPIETTLCAILEHPSAFNNKLVRFRGYASGNFEYSDLGAAGCKESMWFAYGNGDGPPGLVASVLGGARPGSEDAEGRVILPVPVKVVEDANFKRFEKLMTARAKADEKALAETNAETITLYRVAATFTGRIDAVPDDVRAFHIKRKPTDRADFLGFGQMGLFDVQFILQSVGSDAVLETFPPEPNFMRSKTTNP